MSNNLSPCIRGLQVFKKGCPMSSYNPTTGIGCPAWVMLNISEINNPQKKETIGKCIDIWQIELKLRELALLEGNQQAVESFRNGMCFKAEDGKIYPKANGAELALLEMINTYKERQQVIYEHELQKQLINTDHEEVI